MKGFDVSDTHMTYPQIRQTVKHAVSCVDGHDPKTMQLRVTRLVFIEGIRALKAVQGVANCDVNTRATARRCAPMSAGSAT